MIIVQIFQRIFSGFFVALFWLWTGAIVIVDWIGRATILEDAIHAKGLLERSVEWLISTPWWVPGLLATAITILSFRILTVGPFVASVPTPTNGSAEDRLLIDPWAPCDTPTFVELRLNIAEYRSQIINSSNIFEAVTSVRDDEMKTIEILMVFEKWSLCRNAIITCDNRDTGYRTSVIKINERYAICNLHNVISPSIIRIECV